MRLLIAIFLLLISLTVPISTVFATQSFLILTFRITAVHSPLGEEAWIPAFAGMTGPGIVEGSQALAVPVQSKRTPR